MKRNITAAVQAFRRGYSPVAIYAGHKRPYGAGWANLVWDSEEQVKASFEQWTEKGAPGVGLMLGRPSQGLVDVDLDHPKARRLRDHFLPPTPMRTGRPGRMSSHYWYVIEDWEDALPSTRQYKMPDKASAVELRSTGGQTVIPPSIHPSGEKYAWEGEPFGGKEGPAKVSGRKLAVQVALLALGSVLLDAWPAQGSRHEAYLSLAGGLLRYGDGVHEWWEKNLPVVITALAEVSGDEDGADTRVAEVMGTTLARLRESDGKAIGWPHLAELIGNDHAESARRLAREVESLAGWGPQDRTTATLEMPEEALSSTLPPEKRNPIEERLSPWAAIDLEPYLAGEIFEPVPELLIRDDGQGLLYSGKVNMLYGMSESAKTWIAMYAMVQHIAKGERVLYVDLEDDPTTAISRMTALGCGSDDLTTQFRYVNPDGPLSDMQRYKFGHQPSKDGEQNSAVFRELLKSFDPTMVIIDGMTDLYGIHGHDTNDATGTSVVTRWLKTLCRGGRSGVIVIDHTGKGGGPGSSPIGAHHKKAMIQGAGLRVDVVEQPRPGRIGYLQLVIYKDRAGAVRKIASDDSEQIAADVTIDSSVRGVTRMSVCEHDSNKVTVGGSPEMERALNSLAKVSENADKIVDLFHSDVVARNSAQGKGPEDFCEVDPKELTRADVQHECGLSDTEFHDTVRHLSKQGVLEQVSSNRWQRYRLTEGYRRSGGGDNE